MAPASIAQTFTFLLSALCVLIFAIYPLQPPWLQIRPEFVCLLVIYWSLYKPQVLGVGVAWCLGLVQDVVEDSVWGGHALGLALISYLCLMSYRRLRSYHLGQQALWIFIFVGIHQIFVNWIQTLEGYGTPLIYLLISALMTAIAWPMMMMLLKNVRRPPPNA